MNKCFIVAHHFKNMMHFPIKWMVHIFISTKYTSNLLIWMSKYTFIILYMEVVLLVWKWHVLNWFQYWLPNCRFWLFKRLIHIALFNPVIFSATQVVGNRHPFSLWFFRFTIISSLLHTPFAGNWNDNFEDHLVNMNKYCEEFLIWYYKMYYGSKTNAAHCNTSIAHSKALLHTPLWGNVIRSTMELNKQGNCWRLT
jgi:hypothetical protein